MTQKWRKIPQIHSFQLTGCVSLGFSIYALIDGKTVSQLVEEGAAEMGEHISVDIYKTSAIGRDSH